MRPSSAMRQRGAATLCLLVALMASSSCDGGEPSGDAAPATAPSDAVSTDATSGPTGSSPPSSAPEPIGPGTSAEQVCGRLDSAALAEQTGVRIPGGVQSSDEGGQVNCLVQLGGGISSLTVSVLPGDGPLRKSLRYARSSGTEKPERTVVAGEPALLVTSRSTGLVNAGLVADLGDGLLLVRGIGQGSITAEQVRELTLAAGEMVAGG